jgi:TRAP-type mannitol/chloroaromatic compound transport system substrate-binding protein
MRRGAVGLLIGLVVGVVVGATVVAPRNQAYRSPETRPPEPVAAKPEPRPQPPRPEEPPPPPKADAVEWRLASAYAAGVPQLGPLARRLEDNLWRLSEGGIRIKAYDPGTLVPSEEIFDAVSAGAVDAVFASPLQWTARLPGLAILGGLPFGPEAPELLAWYEFGGGKELHREAYGKHNLMALPCGITGPEGGTWTRRPVKGMADLQGLRLAATGLPARVLSRVGADPRPLGGAEIFVALDAKEIDGVAFSTPAIDATLGFHKHLRHYYFPAWHRPAGFHDLVINLDRWKELSPNRRRQVETACGDNLRLGLAEGEAIQFEALKTIQGRNVRLHQWPKEIMAALRKARDKVVAEERGADPLFHKVWQSLSEFRENHAIWREIGHPPEE